MRFQGSRTSQRGFSFFEVIAAIGVLGVIVSIVIPMVANIVPSSRSTAADANLEQLNAAVLKFNHANWELSLTPSSSTSDEEAIFRSLQYRDSATPAPGAPYIEATDSFVATSDIDSYRGVWNGRAFEILPPGTSGAGLDLLRMTGTTPMSFAQNYRPVGAR